MLRKNINRALKYNLKHCRLPMINGTVRSVPIKNLVGYCHYSKHRGFVDADLLKKHSCLKKQCTFLERFEECPFWVHHKNQLMEKQRMAERYQAKRVGAYSTEMKSEWIPVAQDFAQDLGYPVIVTRISKSCASSDRYVINYVSDMRYDDSQKYYSLEESMHAYTGEHFVLRHVKRPDGVYANIDDWDRLADRI